MLPAAYVFVRSNASPQAHLDLARSVIPLDVPVVLDVETAQDGSKPSLEHTRAVLAAFQGAGYHTPLIYIPRWYWQGWGSPSLAGLPPLWSSHYPDNVVGTLASEWADVPAFYWHGYGGLDVAVLQFTSSARIVGYQPLDANAYRDTRDQLAALFNGGVPDMQPGDKFTTHHGTEITYLDYLRDTYNGTAEKYETKVPVDQRPPGDPFKATPAEFTVGNDAYLYAAARDLAEIKAAVHAPPAPAPVTLSQADRDAIVADMLAKLCPAFADAVADKLAARLVS
jgi:hypothetical protein